ncbi:MAG TPA: tRNA preQ1(34) S-adenosylmethionine ribosyltransferase-isomerase QueA [Vicinamibacteria bacterium]|nr:tRNA preQ1(34) S-adenosylmethionine ribosyltransferase-isomerase QueA [Vicinamibacteria bacterium]
MHISKLDYELPAELIAQEPLPERDASRLLVLDRASGEVAHRRFRDLPGLLREGDLLVLNRSRVVPARLLGRRAGGGEAEVLLVRARADGTWDALVRPSRRLRAGAVVEVAADLAVEMAAGPTPGPLRRVRLRALGPIEAVLERRGHVPLPPYIRRPDAPVDRERYQTVYAREPGSVAAPTAGLHFTEAVLAALEARGVERAELVLHVGPGTFRPVAVEQVEDHRVDPEGFVVPEETAEAVARTRARGGRVVAVGTTATRALETAAEEAGGVRAGAGETDLVVVPGHRFRVVDALLTNFHLPRSSLLLLVAAFAGRERVLAAYAEAVRCGYRFYSYGDAMWIH